MRINGLEDVFIDQNCYKTLTCFLGFDWCRSLFTRDGNHMADQPDQLSTQEVRRHRLRTLVLISMLSSINAPVWMCSTI